MQILGGAVCPVLALSESFNLVTVQSQANLFFKVHDLYIIFLDNPVTLKTPTCYIRNS